MQKSIKKQVLALTGWNSAEYNKEYDKLRNKVRNYERAFGAERKNVASELYLIQRAKRFPHVERYKLSLRFEYYKKITSASTGKKISESSFGAASSLFFTRHWNFIQANKQALKIYNDDKLSSLQKVQYITAILNKLTLLRKTAREKLIHGESVEFVNYAAVEIDLK